jgi:6-pyruvoyl-tetrahydropterin synthase
MEKGIFGRIYGKKRSFIENLVKDVDSRIGVQNYSNESLKSFVESNYKVSFNFKFGKKYVNVKDFESIATSYRDNKRAEAYKKITSMIDEVKEKKRLEAYEDVKSFLSELREKNRQEAYNSVRGMVNELVEIDKRNKELCKKLDTDNLDDINVAIGFNCENIVENYNVLDENVCTKYHDSINAALKKRDYATAHELNESMFDKINAKKVDIAKEKIRKGEELEFNDAMLLSKNKTLILSDGIKVYAIENYLAIHPNVVN